MSTSPSAPTDANRASELIASDEPSPVEVIGSGRSPFVILCDHAGRRVPRALGSLGLPEAELERHIAWDLGAAALGRRLAEALDGVLFAQRYSRLVIDCNRPLTSPDSIAARSEYTVIPGNLGLSPEQAAERAREVFEPYHARIRRELDERRALGRPAVLLFVHSFTPVFRGVARPLHAGVLYHRDTRLALPLLAALRRDPELFVGDNEPYAASVETDYGLVEHGERRGLAHVELEVRHDLLATERGQAEWAARLARWFVEEASRYAHANPRRL